ncbi:IS66 family insertion sequence element accessory protein TnpB [Methyloprofundus sp.]|uniref:IS66 family insertion sequence element accessory protein TnpB n=2 Tax=Methyloprofundus sp. TaxID=2020875 RepID=UPI003D096EFF
MTVVMRPSLSLTEVYLYRQPIDFRKSHRGLSAIVECELGHNPFEGALYAFTNKRRNKIKCLFWEDNGFVLYYKSLVEETFKWPKGEEETLTLTGQQLNWLLDGFDISAMKGHKKLQYESVF